ncbi:hypothetical protein [Lysobacter sp. Hz 25]|uniref:hypothetical protein n=1 Tax=Lysobacter sp. Hz 25 TaxID=3383698 RepID=UPI0038D46B6C
MTIWGKIAIPALALAGLFGWILTKPKHVSGDELKSIVVASDKSSAGTWYLYDFSGDVYCLKYSRPIFSERYCVPKNDVELMDGGSPVTKNGFMGEGGFVLKKERFPGAVQETF